MESPEHFKSLCKAFTTLCMLVFSPAVPGGGIGGGGKPGGGPGNGGGGGSPGGKLPGGGIPGGIALEGGRIPVGGWPSGCCGGGWYDIAWKPIRKFVKLCQRKVRGESNMAALVFKKPSVRWETSFPVSWNGRWCFESLWLNSFSICLFSSSRTPQIQSMNSSFYFYSNKRVAFKPRKKTEIKAKRMRKNVRMRRQGSLHHKEHSEHNEHYIYIPWTLI